MLKLDISRTITKVVENLYKGRVSTVKVVNSVFRVYSHKIMKTRHYFSSSKYRFLKKLQVSNDKNVAPLVQTLEAHPYILLFADDLVLIAGDEDDFLHLYTLVCFHNFGIVAREQRNFRAAVFIASRLSLVSSLIIWKKLVQDSLTIIIIIFSALFFVSVGYFLGIVKFWLCYSG